MSLLITIIGCIAPISWIYKLKKRGGGGIPPQNSHFSVCFSAKVAEGSLRTMKMGRLG